MYEIQDIVQGMQDKYTLLTLQYAMRCKATASTGHTIKYHIARRKIRA